MESIVGAPLKGLIRAKAKYGKLLYNMEYRTLTRIYGERVFPSRLLKYAYPSEMEIPVEDKIYLWMITESVCYEDESSCYLLSRGYICTEDIIPLLLIRSVLKYES